MEKDKKVLLEEFIKEKIINSHKQVDLKNSTNLIEEGIIDSLGIMKLLSFIEETFKIQITDEELMPENFETVDSIYQMIANKLVVA
jgi:acyl carrier protein